jgi:hypothetical protein
MNQSPLVDGPRGRALRKFFFGWSDYQSRTRRSPWCGEL